MKALSSKFLVITMILVIFSVSACGPGLASQPPADPSSISVNEKTRMLIPDTDNGKSYNWSGGVEVSNETFFVTAQVEEESTNHTEINASGGSYGYMSGGFGFAGSSFRVWQDGKGLLPALILNITPDYPYVSINQHAILKTSDLKTMAVPSGATIELICNDDVEVLSPSFSGQILTSDKITHELDNCRMTSPEYVPVQ